MKLQIFALIILLLCSCNREPYAKETKIFNKYLQETFQFTIAGEPMTYILLPQAGCKGCMQKYIAIIHNGVDSLETTKIKLITSNGKMVSNKIRAKLKVFDDEFGNLDYMALDVVCMMVINTKDKKIIEIRDIQIADTAHLLTYLATK